MKWEKFALIWACSAAQSYSSAQYFAMDSIVADGGPSVQAGWVMSVVGRNFEALRRVRSIKAGSTLMVYGRGEYWLSRGAAALSNDRSVTATAGVFST